MKIFFCWGWPWHGKENQETRKTIFDYIDYFRFVCFDIGAGRKPNHCPTNKPNLERGKVLNSNSNSIFSSNYFQYWFRYYFHHHRHHHHCHHHHHHYVAVKLFFGIATKKLRFAVLVFVFFSMLVPIGTHTRTPTHFYPLVRVKSANQHRFEIVNSVVVDSLFGCGQFRCRCCC